MPHSKVDEASGGTDADDGISMFGNEESAEWGFLTWNVPCNRISYIRGAALHLSIRQRTKLFIDALVLLLWANYVGGLLLCVCITQTEMRR